MTVVALFVDAAGVYPTLVDRDWCWDIDRDARTYVGPHPVVAHPPCHLWVNMAAVNWKRYKRQKPAWYPGGSDGGCFKHAIQSVWLLGGVVEHPASSHAWEFNGLPTPVGPDGRSAPWLYCGRPSGMHRNGFKQWVCEVWQSAYGHKARKRTWLLYCGARPPFELRWQREPGTHQVGWFDRNKPTLSKREASATPAAFAEELIRLAEWSRGRDDSTAKQIETGLDSTPGRGGPG